jgi:hypothetical protein
MVRERVSEAPYLFRRPAGQSSRGRGASNPYLDLKNRAATDQGLDDRSMDRAA